MPRQPAAAAGMVVEFWSSRVRENTQDVPALIACLLRQGKPVPAELEERSLQIAIEQEPANPQPVLSLIACLLRQGKPVPAELEERSLQIAIEQEPANPQPVLSLIACLLRQGKPVPAELEERSLQIAIEQEPANPQPVLSLIACLLRQGKPVPAELEERSLQIAIEQEPANPQPVLSLIACLLRQGKPVPAELEERSLQIAIEQEPANPQPVLSLIACLLRRGKPVPAELEERSLWLAVEHGPQNMAQLRNLISCLQLQGKAVPAELEERWLRIVVEQNPNEDGQAARLIGTRRMTSGALVRFNRAFGAMDYKSAYAHIIAALESNPVSTWRVIVGTCSAAFSKVIRAVSKKAEIAALLDRLYADFPDIIVMTPNDDPAVLDQLKAQRAGNIDKGLPYYLFVPQAKSGSTFFGNVIPQGFGLTCPTYSAIDLQVVPSWAKAYRLGGSAYVTHLVPSPSNVALLRETGLTKVVVNTAIPARFICRLSITSPSTGAIFPNSKTPAFFRCRWTTRRWPNCRGTARSWTGWQAGSRLRRAGWISSSPPTNGSCLTGTLWSKNCSISTAATAATSTGLRRLPHMDRSTIISEKAKPTSGAQFWAARSPRTEQRHSSGLVRAVWLEGLS